MQFTLPPLPYPKDALAPHISERTLEFHYEKHHKGYLATLKAAIEGKPLAEESLVDIICKTDEQRVFNSAAQVWNHTFYWNSLAPNAPAKPNGALAEAITRDFGSLDAVRRELAEVAKGQFGSGWGWLVKDDEGRLHVWSSSNAENPLRSSRTALLTIDVWEHAYYLDYQNDRAKYVQGIVDHLLNWPFAEKNYGA